MIHYMAEIDSTGICLRVIVAPNPEWPGILLGGLWREVADPYNPDTDPATYPGPGWRWDNNLSRWLPWSVDTDIGTLFCVTELWVATPLDDRQAFLDMTGLVVTEDLRDGVLHTMFGGRPITNEDQIALAEVLGP